MDTALWPWELWSEVPGARPLHAVSCGQVKLQEAQSGGKKECMRVPVAPLPSQHLMLSVFQDIGHSNGCT